MSDEKKLPLESDRRLFIKFWTGVLGTVTGLLPLLAGLPMVLDPLRRQGSPSKLVKVANLEALPKDNLPRIFPINAERVDAWNKFPQVRIGTVFLRRLNDGTVKALNVSCPHLGCAVDLKDDPDPEKREFSCPCHNSQFKLDGSIKNLQSTQSPRDMDELVVDEEKLKEGEVWVHFQNFQPNKAEKIPVG